MDAGAPQYHRQRGYRVTEKKRKAKICSLDVEAKAMLIWSKPASLCTLFTFDQVPAPVKPIPDWKEEL